MDYREDIGLEMLGLVPAYRDHRQLTSFVSTNAGARARRARNALSEYAFEKTGTDLFTLAFRLIGAIVTTAIVVGIGHAETSQTAKLNDDDVRQASFRKAIALSELEVAYKKREADAYIAYLNNNVAALQAEQVIRREIFSSQLRHHPWVLGSVIILVFAGVLLAYFQVLTAQRAQSIAIPAAASSEGGQPLPTPADPINVSQSELEISRDKLVLRSHIVGLLILLISLGFFYLYLVYVYTIHPEGLAKPDSESSAYQSKPTTAAEKQGEQSKAKQDQQLNAPSK